MDAFLDTVEQVPFPTRSGTCALPILYRDASQLGLFFRVDPARALEVIGPDATIEPWPIAGRAVVAIEAWEYRDSTVGAYGEVGLGIQCRRRGTRPSALRLAMDMGAQDDQGIWVVDLPVTTQAAHDAGVDLWGYPKYVSPITTEFRERDATVSLGAELSIELGALGGPRLRAQPLVTYTERAGRLLRTRIDQDHVVRWGRGARAKLTLRGDGPMATSLRALGLERATPIAAFRADHFRARLPAGVDLGPARAS